MEPPSQWARNGRRPRSTKRCSLCWDGGGQPYPMNADRVVGGHWLSAGRGWEQDERSSGGLGSSSLAPKNPMTAPSDGEVASDSLLRQCYDCVLRREL